MKRNIAALLAVLLALQMPAASMAAAGAVPVPERPKTEVSESDLPDSGSASGGSLPGGDGPADSSALPGGVFSVDGEKIPAATPLDAEKQSGVSKVSLLKVGDLKIDIHSVVPAKESVWQVELYPVGGSSEEERRGKLSTVAEEQTEDFSTIAEEQTEGLSTIAEEQTEEFSTVAEEQAGDFSTIAEERMEEFSATVQLPSNEDNSSQETTVLLKDIPVGTYDLRMETAAEGDSSYLPYEQKGIEIGEDLTILHLMNDDPAQHGYGQSAERFGILSMGDINGDHVLDESDEEILMDIIAKGEHYLDVYYSHADLNGDDAVNLLDVSAFARYYGTGLTGRVAQPVKNLLIRLDEVTGTVAGNTEIEEGSLEDLIAGSDTADKLKLKGKKPISEEPLEIAAEFTEAKTMEGFSIDPVPGSGDCIRDGEVIVETGNGEKQTFVIRNGQAFPSASAVRLMRTGVSISAAEISDDEMLQGMPIVIELNGQVAVKKITIKVDRTMSGGDLAEISKVEFYGDMEDRIPQEPMSVPERLVVENESEAFTLTWKKMPNVTSYEIKVTGSDSKGRTSTDTYSVEDTAYQVTKIGNGDLVNGNTYSVEVRSQNGKWRSAPAAATAAPRAMGPPPAPEDLEIQAGYRRLTISWKDMKDTETYNLYYREAVASGTSYQSVEGIAEHRYELTGLKDETEYEFYLKGVNAIGTGPESLHYTASTTSLDPPQTPKYKLINVEQAGRSHTAHIESVAHGGEGGHEFDVVDGRYDTAWVRSDWDAGFSYPGDEKAPIVTFDKEYEMDTVIIVPDDAQTYDLGGATLQYWKADGTSAKLPTVIRRKVSSNNKVYYVFQTLEPFTAKRVQLQMGNLYGHAGRISVAEMKFYYYDPLEQDIMDLYEDSYHVVLRPDVTMTNINNLRSRLTVKDTVSGEYHPKKTELGIELDNAEKILKDGSLQAEILAVDPKDTMRSDGHITFRGGLNVYQPLGVTALAGETLTVYVGGPAVRNGDVTRLELVISQYHGSSKAVFKSLGYLKGGPNEITVTALDDMKLERGGQIYVQYTGDPGAEQYGVRVSGGHASAVLDLSDTTSTEERVQLASAYLTELKKQDEESEAGHRSDHAGYEWDPKECIYQGTDILTRYGMISTAAQQVFAGLGNGSLDEQARKLERSMRAFDEMMVLFYQHKGLSEDPDAPAANRVPVSRINIRYQRMFAGAFMYAGGKHIGIEWPELAGMMGGEPVEADSEGRYAGTGKYFGWGISHEIGHEINEGAYAIAEITNNYFSVLAQADDTNDTVRFDYDDVFKKVTSGTKGRASDVFVQLAMYWQLHLAYDLGGYNYKIYEDNEEQLENLFFARVDSYVRDMDSAPGAEGNELTLDGADTDNKLMRLATAAAQKDLLGFFRRWGMEPDAGTIRYAEQFEPETRGIWFANDETRAEQLGSGTGQNRAEGVTPSGNIDYRSGSNEVTLDLSCGSGDIWMYEIYRYERVKNEIVRRPVGYARADGSGNAEYTDVIGTINNHTFTYEVVGYDTWLNPTERVEIGSVKVSHDGKLDKSLWEVTTNLTNDDLEQPNEVHPDTTFQPGTEAMIDNDNGTAFTGKTASGTDPEIILYLNQEETITGLEYRAASGTAIGDFEIYVSQNGDADWKPVTVSEDHFSLTDGAQVIHFHDEKNLYTYDASSVKLVARGQGGRDLTITELSLIGQTGDDIVLEETGSIGILSKAYTGSNGESIPQGSLVFTGEYKGNPAFNQVLLWDENGELVAGTDENDELHAAQIIFAPDPGEDGLLGEVRSGTWIYYIEPQYVGSVKSKKVRAELYRVDDAHTLAGERLVSSTLFVDLPAERPSLEINPGGDRS